MDASKEAQQKAARPASGERSSTVAGRTPPRDEPSLEVVTGMFPVPLGPLGMGELFLGTHTS